MDDIFLRY